MRRLLLPAGFLAALAVSLSSAQAAQPGTLDPTFGHDGLVTTHFGSGDEGGRAIAIQPDGRIVVVGSAKKGFGLVRYLQNGALDPSFGPNRNGTVETAIGSSSFALSVLIQPDGKIIAGGGADGNFALARYLPDGRLDPSFGQGGTITTLSKVAGSVYGLSLEPGGKILAAGLCIHFGQPDSYDVVLARYNPDGSLDQTFGDQGKVSTQSLVVPFGFAFQSDGKILVSGPTTELPTFGVMRLNPSGSIDRGFGNDGVAGVPMGDGSFTSGVVVQSDGKIVVDGWGYSGSRQVFALARLNSNGSPDTSFGQQGSVTTDIGTAAVAEALAVDASGRIVAVGSSVINGTRGAFAVARYLPDGSLDPSFGIHGVKSNAFGVDAGARAMAIQPNGRIVATGDVELRKGPDVYAVVRYLSSSHDLVCTVPAVKGRRLVLAKRAIQHGHCTVGRIEKAFSTRVGRGLVLGQKPRAGAVRAPGAPVGLRVSKGSRTQRH